VNEKQNREWTRIYADRGPWSVAFPRPRDEADRGRHPCWKAALHESAVEQELVPTVLRPLREAPFSIREALWKFVLMIR
jgi:hypothetical protein